MISSEFEELKRICEERKITPEKLLEEKVAPIQDKISKFPGELICAITRDYEQGSHGVTPVHYSLGETLYAGIITPNTGFPIGKELFGNFLLGIDKPYSLDLDSFWERDFSAGAGNGFGIWTSDWTRLLYFHERPIPVPEDSMSFGCFGSNCTVIPTEKPRLEFYIGNSESVDFLQQRLEGFRYLQLSKLLEYNLPITDELTKRIEEEQLKIFDKIRETNDRAKVLGLLGTAVKRGYHETGVLVNRGVDAGVVLQINLKEFFSQRKAQFGL